MSKRLSLSVQGAALMMAAAVMPDPVAACSIVAPRIGEVQEAPEAVFERRRRADQRYLWAQADHVVLVRVVSAYDEPPPRPAYDPTRDGPPRPPEPVAPGGWLKTRFEPIAALKGVAPPRAFDFQHSEFTDSCGGRPLADAFGAPEGALLVVFVRGPYPAQDRLVGALGVGNEVDPDIKAALARAGH